MKKKFFVFLFLTSFVLAIVVTAIYYELFLCLNRAIESCNYENEEIFEEMYEEPEQIEVEQEPEKEEPKLVSLGDFRLTAYCSCKKCCGKWADNRPVDENGNQIVCGASGAVLESGFSCASPLEFGTQIELNGIGLVEVQDRTSNWIVNKYGNNVIDIYMNDHEKAKIFGVRYVEGVIK